jgi:F-type H+-transporting ATPase subunit b
MFDEKFWLAISFLVFVILIIKFTRLRILKYLDDKTQAIAEEISSAKKIKEKTIQLLKEAEKYRQESEEYAKKLLQDAQKEVQTFAAEAKKAAELEISKRTNAALDRIKIEETAAIRKIKIKIIASATQSISENFFQESSEKQQYELLNQAARDFEKLLIS